MPPQGYVPDVNGPYSATGAIGYGWNQFSKAPARVLIPALIYFVVLVVVVVIAELLVFLPLVQNTTTNPDGTTTTSSAGVLLFFVGAAIMSFIVMAVSQILQAGVVKAALGVTDGKAYSLGELYRGWDKGKVIIAAILVGLMTGVGFLLCYLPGIVLAYLSMFTIYFVVDKDMSPVDAIKASFAMTTQRLGETVVFAILSYLVVMVGFLVCGIGALVSVPVAIIATAFAFRRLHGEPVVPVPN